MHEWLEKHLRTMSSRWVTEVRQMDVELTLNPFKPKAYSFGILAAQTIQWELKQYLGFSSKKKSGVDWCTSAEEKEAACNNIGEPAWLPSPLPALIEGNPLWLRSAAALPLLSTTVIKTSAQLFASLYTVCSQQFPACSQQFAACWQSIRQCCKPPPAATAGEISSDLYGLSGCDILNLTFCRLDFHQLLIKIS